MRRVYDDARYDEVSKQIFDVLLGITNDTISEYDYGTYRAQVSKIRERVKSKLPNIKFGKNEHAYGIGNNNAIEIIVVGENEEQIAGYFHLTDDMYGSVICWCSDIDGNRSTRTLKFSGCDKKSEYDMKYKRYPRYNDTGVVAKNARR